jgi:curved DNA-binding protein CbpA
VTANLPQPSPTRTAEPEEEETAELVEFDLEDVLKRIETAANYYQILGVEPAAKVAAIRKAYFGLAKMLHPDRYHNETKELLRRVEKAFTELAQAHETLKNSATRQSYDMRMHQAELDKERGVSETGGTRQEDRAAADFERGFALQLDGQFDAAVPYLARAVHYSPNNARYHAYYGKTLSADEDQRHKAQNELLKAVQLEPSNVVFRLLLAEFYVKYKLLKRAEGELNRLLEIAPDNREARKLLDSLQVKSLN